MTDNLLFPTDKQPILRVKTLPNDANPTGEIFGGWLMSQIDIAGAIAARTCSNGPVATVAVKELRFIKPLFVFDLVSFYADVTHVGNTSITVTINVYAQRYNVPHEVVDISTAVFIYVAISEPGTKRIIQK